MNGQHRAPGMIAAMDQPGLRERKKAKTRRALQDAALELIDQQGYDTTTVEQIAAAAEVSPSTFFRYFPTKEDVILEDEYDPRIVAAIENQHADLPPVAAARAAFAETFDTIGGSDREMLLRRVQLSLSVPALRARMYDQARVAEDRLAGALAVHLGRAADDFDVAVTVAAVIATLSTAVERWASGGGKGDLPKMVDHALAVLQHGLDAVPVPGAH